MWEGGPSFISLADHLAASSGRLPAMMFGNATTPDTLASIKQKLNTLSHLGDEILAWEVKVFGGARMTVGALMDISLTHEAHHKVQVRMMARLVGM